MIKQIHRRVRRGLLYIISLYALWLNPLNAQVDFYGYGETEMDQILVSGQSYTFGYTKMRLDSEWRPRENIFIGGNVTGQKYFGKTEWNFLDFIPKPIWEEFFPEGEMNVNIPDTIYLDNIYTRINFSIFDLTLGRQPLSLGTGYAWNPLDIFNQKDLLDPTYEQPGVDALRLEVALNERSTLDIILADDDSTKNGSGMIQLKSGIGRFDLTLNYARRYHLYPYWRFTDGSSTHEVLHLFGGSIVGQVGEFGLWGESLSSYHTDYGYTETVLGIDHTFDNGLYVMGEYFHNGLGATDKELDFTHYAHSFGGESKSLMQNYIFALTMFAFNDFISGSFMAFGNMDDKSFSVVPQLTWSVFENVSLSFFLSQSFGKDDSEFGVQDRSLRLRMRAYF